MSNSICVVIPAYNRTEELSELLDSVLLQIILPDNVLICEDCSPEREKIIELYNSYSKRFEEKGIGLRLNLNSTNLGYDKNVRKCLHEASADWAIIMGNDDILLPNCIGTVKKFIEKNNVKFISRTFLRFVDSIDEPKGISSLFNQDVIISPETYSPKYIFRSAGFVGGLVINLDFAKKYETDKYDGSLYYQIYLAALAYLEGGIGYISTPIIGGRADNPPMFGQSEDDKEFHVPGSYSAKGRARMWQGVLDIAKEIDDSRGVNLTTEIKRELRVRQSFHVFEMNAGQPYVVLKELKSELSRLDLFNHPLPIGLYLFNIIFGRKSRFGYSIMRRILQRNNKGAV
ncbi:glycosyltransferase [Aeromonas enteropelogenes]|uniref:glycosyltransferase n=1 Tax=Aeromonas enteropelogenes TaxID=29489 RepID=UPI003B9F80FD